ncbi:MAG: DUF1080 domain-containing protein [Reichenbachiella sp.]
MKLNITISFLFLLSMSCSEVLDKPLDKNEQLAWENLIDEDISQWDQYLSYQHQTGYDGSQPLDDNGALLEPIGLNQTSYNVFTTKEVDDGQTLRVSGEYYGCIITKKEYKNYHFQLKYKWGNKKWAIRKDKLKDSGILYHSVGPMGVEYWRSWMLSQEFQIMEGHTGDFWSQANSIIDIRAYKPESVLDPLANESQDYIPIGLKSPFGNYCLRSSNNENPHDEWNTLDLYCYEGKSLHVVNGKVVMVLKNSSYLDENQKTIPLIKGKIQLQSEAAEIFFKDIRIREINSLSKAQESLF